MIVLRKLTVPEVEPMVRAYYAKAGNGTGGSLHIVLDDENVEDSHVEFCEHWAESDGDEDGVRLARALRLMSRTQRLRLANLRDLDRGF